MSRGDVARVREAIAQAESMHAQGTCRVEITPGLEVIDADSASEPPEFLYRCSVTEQYWPR